MFNLELIYSFLTWSVLYYVCDMQLGVWMWQHTDVYEMSLYSMLIKKQLYNNK